MEEEEEAAVCDRKAYGVTCRGEAGDEGMDMLTAALFVCQRSCGLSGLPVTLPSLLSLSHFVCVWVCGCGLVRLHLSLSTHSHRVCRHMAECL
jgi:hypothetical protein